MPTCLSLSTQGPVARVTLARPEVRNAFNADLIAELTAAFAQIAAAPDVRAVLLAAEGPAFCAGADLRWMQAMAAFSWDENHADASRLAEMFWVIDRCPVPVIARIQGDAYAGGVGLVACADIAVSVDTASYCLSEARLGLLPGTIAPYVVRAMGERAARRYFTTAERFGAAEALRLGLVHDVVAAHHLDARVDELVAPLCANGPAAVRACKRLVQDVAGREITPSLRDDTARRIADIRASDEGRAGVASFLNKTTPPWR